MKNWILFSACLIMAIAFLGCEEEEDKVPYRTSIAAITRDGKYVPDVDLYFYKTEQDYISDRNVVFQGKTDSNGKFIYERTKQEFYYFRAKKGDLNNVRRHCYNTETAEGCPSSTGLKGIATSITILLTRTPVKLLLNVYDAGNPVSGAEVQLYFRQEDYENDYTYWDDIHDVSVPSMKMEGITASDGSIFFSDLEPRQYWFKITKGDKNNSTTTIKTPAALEDNPNITNSFDIGIK